MIDERPMGSTRATRLLHAAAWIMFTALTWLFWYRAFLDAGGSMLARIHPTEVVIGGWAPIEPAQLVLAAVAYSAMGFGASLIGIGATRLLNAPRHVALVAVVLSVWWLSGPLLVSEPGPARSIAFLWTPSAFTVLGAWMGSRVSPLRWFRRPSDLVSAA